MKKVLKLSAFITALTITISVTGCKKKDSADNMSKGGYVEEEMDVNLQVYSLSEFCLIDGKISIFDTGANEKYCLSEDGNSFLKGSDVIMNKSDYGTSEIITASEMGYLIRSFGDSSEEVGYYFVDAEGVKNKLNIVSSYACSAEFTSDGKLFVTNDGKLSVVSLTNYSVKPIMSVGFETKVMDIIGDNIIIVDENGTHMYDYKNEKETEVPQVLSDFFSERNGSQNDGVTTFDMCSGENNSIYIACSDGIFRYVMNGNQIEQLIDGTVCSLGDLSLELSSIIHCKDDTIYAAFKDGKILKYRYDPDLITTVSSVLTIYSLEKNDTLSQTIRSFAASNRNIKVDYQVGMRNGITYDDAMKELTTQILSGSAPDVIMLDGIDIDNYIDKNMLSDLSESEKIWNPNGTLLDNVAKWNKKSDSIYSVACRFRIPAVGTHSEEVETIKCLEDIADKVEEYREKYDDPYPIIYVESPEAAIKLGLIYEGNDVIDNGSVNKDKLEEMFDSCERIYNNSQNQSNPIRYGMHSQDIENEYIFATRVNAALLDDHTLALGTINTFDSDLNMVTSIDTLSVPSDIEVRYGIGDNDKLFIPTCNLGIIEAGKNKDAAVKFIATALGVENQKIDHNDGFPVNTDTLEWFYNKNKNMNNNVFNFECSSMGGNREATMNLEWMTNMEVEDFDNYIHNLNEPVIMDTITKTIIVDAGVKCIEGSMSPSEAADEAVRQLHLRMKE